MTARARRSTRVDPKGSPTFVAFTKALGVTLTAGQRVLASVAFDGVDPVDLHRADRETARKLFGAVDRFPAEARHVVAAVCGARAGKSFVLVALRALHLALTCDLSQLAAGELAAAIIIAPDMRLARQALRFALGSAKKLGPNAVGNTTKNSFDLSRPDGRIVRVECLPAARGGAAGRGRSLVFAGLDEVAFHRDEEFEINDADTFRAVAPRVLPDGQVVLASTPWAKSGLLWSFLDREHGAPKTAIVARAPTDLLRDDAHTLALVARERQRDPTNAAREFGAEFLDVDSSAWFDAEAIDACTADRPATLPPDPRARVHAAIDLGFRRDASALVIVHDDGKRIRVAETIELRPTKGQPLRPSEVVSTFAQAVRRHGGDRMVGDLVYIQSAIEHAEEHGVQVIAGPTGARTKLQTYASARHLLAEGQLDVSRGDDRLLRQLREVTATPTSGGGVSIGSPRRGGAHGDLVSALVLALWSCTWARTYDEHDDDGGDTRVTIFSPDGTFEFGGDDDEQPENRAEHCAEPQPAPDIPEGWRLVRPEDFGAE